MFVRMYVPCWVPSPLMPCLIRAHRKTPVGGPGDFEQESGFTFPSCASLGKSLSLSLNISFLRPSESENLLPADPELMLCQRYLLRGKKFFADSLKMDLLPGALGVNKTGSKYTHVNYIKCK